MEQVLNHLIVLGGIIATMCVAYFAWVVSGVGNMVVKSSLKNWSWKRFRADLIKFVCFTASMMACSISSDVLAYYVKALEIDALNSAMEVISWGVIVGVPIIATFYLVYRALNNNKSLVGYKQALETFNIKENELKIRDDPEKVAEIANHIYDIFSVPDRLADKHLHFEQEGGQGTYYSVPITSYDDFRSTVIGKGWDIDNAFSWQCWDLCGLLYQQLGRTLATGNGCAYGCWTLKRDYNTGNGITAIYNKADVKRGDIVIFGGGQYGHIGYADEDYSGGAYIRLLGQNQGGAPGPNGVGATANVVNVSMANFLGAFRYEKWHTVSTKPTTTTTTTTTTTSTTTKKPSVTPIEFHVGDKVVPIEKVDYDGRRLRQYDDTYTITQISGDRAVLSARGAIWAALRTDNIRKA